LAKSQAFTFNLDVCRHCRRVVLPKKTWHHSQLSLFAHFIKAVRILQAAERPFSAEWHHNRLHFG
jgi:hypothetical protein